MSTAGEALTNDLNAIEQNVAAALSSVGGAVKVANSASQIASGAATAAEETTKEMNNLAGQVTALIGRVAVLEAKVAALEGESPSVPGTDPGTTRASEIAIVGTPPTDFVVGGNTAIVAQTDYPLAMDQDILVQVWNLDAGVLLQGVSWVSSQSTPKFLPDQIDSLGEGSFEIQFILRTNNIEVERAVWQISVAKTVSAGLPPRKVVASLSLQSGGVYENLTVTSRCSSAWKSLRSVRLKNVLFQDGLVIQSGSSSRPNDHSINRSSDIYGEDVFIEGAAEKNGLFFAGVDNIKFVRLNMKRNGWYGETGRNNQKHNSYWLECSNLELIDPQSLYAGAQGFKLAGIKGYCRIIRPICEGNLIDFGGDDRYETGDLLIQGGESRKLGGTDTGLKVTLARGMDFEYGIRGDGLAVGLIDGVRPPAAKLQSLTIDGFKFIGPADLDYTPGSGCWAVKALGKNIVTKSINVDLTEWHGEQGVVS